MVFTILTLKGEKLFVPNQPERAPAIAAIRNRHRPFKDMPAPSGVHGPAATPYGEQACTIKSSLY